MKHLIILTALLAGACAARESDFLAMCQAEVAAKPIPPRVAAVLTTEAQQSSYRAGSVRICQTYRAGMARLQQQESRAMVAAVIFGAASDALAEHNFYVYDVPRAARYLRRNGR